MKYGVSICGGNRAKENVRGIREKDKMEILDMN